MKETVTVEMGDTVVRAGVTIRPVFGGVEEVHSKKGAPKKSVPIVRFDLEYPDPAAPGSTGAPVPKQ